MTFPVPHTAYNTGSVSHAKSPPQGVHRVLSRKVEMSAFRDSSEALYSAKSIKAD